MFIRIIQTIKSLLIFVFGFSFVIISWPFALAAMLMKRKENYAKPPRFAIWAVQTMARFFTWLAGCRLTIEGSENIPDSPAVFVGNHQGDFDVLMILFALGEPKVIMAKKEASYVPIARLWMKLINCIFVDRKNMRKAIESMNESEEYLRHGHSVLYFPEGTRSHGPNMNAFKNGAFRTAVKTQTQIVPFAIDGSYKVFEQNGYLKKSKVVFRILPPIQVSQTDDVKELSAKVKDLIQKELDDIRKN